LEGLNESFKKLGIMAFHRRSHRIFGQRVCGNGYQRAGEWVSKRITSGFGRIWNNKQPDKQDRLVAAVVLFAKDYF
jgi:hypothetical protein